MVADHAEFFVVKITKGFGHHRTDSKLELDYQGFDQCLQTHCEKFQLLHAFYTCSCIMSEDNSARDMKEEIDVHVYI